MFETTVIESRPRKSNPRRVSTLPVSLLLHALAAGGALVASVWTVAFPANAPDQIVLYSLATPPPPMPPPPPPPAGRKITAPVHKIERPKEIVAPVIIPDEIPIVESVSSQIDETSTAVGVEGGVEGGVVGGEVGGVMGGEVGGVAGGVVGSVVTATKGPLRVYEDVKLPRFISQVFPEYPEKARWSGIQGTVTVEYIIGIDGKVRHVTVIKELHPLLAKAAVDAIRRWRFRPTVVNGEPVEVVHKLAVIFELN